MDQDGLQSLEALDRAIVAADDPGADRGALISSILYLPNTDALATLDPFSQEYLLEVKRIYEEMRGHAYDVEDEANLHEYSLTEPSPYSSRHPHLICGHVGAIVTVIRDIGKLPPARVLDLGFGAGDSSLLLARCGFSVDAVDVNPRYVELLGYWAGRMHVEDRVNIIHSAFDALDAAVGPYDVVLFFEAFHHALAHAGLIAAIAAKLKPDGVILFAGEPIHDHYSLPWGLRHTEGLATYCIRKFGWMELGFSRSYFLELLERHGLYATYRGYADYPVANHYRAMPVAGGIPIAELCIRRPYEAGWHPADGDQRWTTGRAGLPMALFAGASAVAIELGNFSPAPMMARVLADETLLVEQEIPSGTWVDVTVAFDRAAASLWIDVPAWSPRAIGLSADARTLGVAVRKVRWV